MRDYSKGAKSRKIINEIEVLETIPIDKIHLNIDGTFSLEKYKRFISQTGSIKLVHSCHRSVCKDTNYTCEMYLKKIRIAILSYPFYTQVQINPTQASPLFYERLFNVIFNVDDLDISHIEVNLDLGCSLEYVHQYTLVKNKSSFEKFVGIPVKVTKTRKGKVIELIETSCCGGVKDKIKFYDKGKQLGLDNDLTRIEHIYKSKRSCSFLKFSNLKELKNKKIFSNVRIPTVIDLSRLSKTQVEYYAFVENSQKLKRAGLMLSLGDLTDVRGREATDFLKVGLKKSFGKPLDLDFYFARNLDEYLRMPMTDEEEKILAVVKSIASGLYVEHGPYIFNAGTSDSLESMSSLISTTSPVNTIHIPTS